jgi:Plavaka transposase
MDIASSQRLFKCTCTREFTQESAFTKHQRSCLKGKKRLISALSKAKDLLGSVKRARLDTNGNRQHVCISTPSSITHPRCPQAPSSSSNHVNETYSVGSSSLHPSLPLAAVHPPGEVPSAGSSIQDNIPIAASNANIGTTSTEEDGLSLAQRRSRRVDVRMPSRYRQYDDVLPQPPPSVPSHIVQQTESIPVANSTSILTTACTSSRPAPFRTARNVFGLVRQFFSSTPPSHDPEEAATLHDISSIPIPTPAGQYGPAEPHNSFHPYPNQTSFELGHWYWNGTAQKSHQSFKGLLDIIGCSDFDPNDVRHTHWDKINSKLGASVDEEDDEWLDEDAGWRKTEVTIEVPFSRTTAQPGVRPYIAADLYHRSLISVIREKLANAEDVEHFHYEPYRLRWKPPHLPQEVNIQGELYTSPAFMEAHSTLQESPGEPGCDLPRVVTALMIWSDATQLTTFGNAKLWPVYMYFGNESKYRRCKPSHHLGNHVAYFQKVC